MEKIFFNIEAENMDDLSDKKTQRAATIEHVSIDLTENDPVERLKEFCRQGFYYYKWTWDKFQNGILCDIEIRYKFMNKRVAAKETKFVFTTELPVAQRIVAKALLEKLGLICPTTVKKKLSWAEISSYMA